MKATCSCGKIYDYDPKRPGLCPACVGSLKGDRGQGERKNHWTAMHVGGWRWIDKRSIYFPNKMEANYFRYLMFLRDMKPPEIKSFDYQPPEFDFRSFGITRGVVTYRADFRIQESGLWTYPLGIYYVELKGYIGPDHKTKMNRMKKFYPNIKIKVIDYKAYKELAAYMKNLIPGWES